MIVVTFKEFSKAIDQFVCALRMICPIHRTPLDVYGEKKVFCPECEDEKARSI